MQVWIGVQDSSGNLNKDIKVISIHTADIVGPDFALGAPLVAQVKPPNFGIRTATISVALNEPGDATCIIEPCISALTHADCVSFIAPSVRDIVGASTAGSVASSMAGLPAAFQMDNVTLAFHQVCTDVYVFPRALPMHSWSSSWRQV
jgi:hypothetical protein